MSISIKKILLIAVITILLFNCNQQSANFPNNNSILQSTSKSTQSPATSNSVKIYNEGDALSIVYGNYDKTKKLSLWYPEKNYNINLFNYWSQFSHNLPYATKILKSEFSAQNIY